MLTRFFRPGALPLVMPFNVSLPPGVVILPNFYVIDLPLYKLFLEKQPIVYRQDTVLVVAKFASDFNKVLVEIEFISPIISDWFFGLYFTAFNESRCTCWFSSRVTHKKFKYYGHIFYNNEDYIHNDFLVDTTSQAQIVKEFTSNHIMFLSITLDRFKRKSFYRSQKVVNKQYKSTKFRSHASMDGEYITHSLTRQKPVFLNSPLDIELAPLEDRLYTLTVFDEITTIIMLIQKCEALTTFESFFSNKKLFKKKRANKSLFQNQSLSENNCSLLLDASAGSLPLSLSSAFYSGTLHDSFKNKLNAMIIDDYSIKLAKFYFEGLQGSRVQHYLYIRNQATISLRIRLNIFPKMHCEFLTLLGTFNFLNRTTQRFKFSNGTSVKEQIQINPQEFLQTKPKHSNWTISLLPWINPHWPELTPDYGFQRWLKTKKYSPSNTVIFSNFGSFSSLDPAHQTLPKCLVWSSPTRVQMRSKYAYVFTYQASLIKIYFKRFQCLSFYYRKLWNCQIFMMILS